MELKRVIGKDSKHAMELVRQEFGPDALVVSSHKVNRKFEMIVAVDITPDPSLIDQADDLLVEVKAQGEQKQTPCFSAVLHGEQNQEPAMTNDRAQEIVNLFKTEMQLLKKELAQLRSASAWQQHNTGTDNRLQTQLNQYQLPSTSKLLILDAINDITCPKEAESRIHDLFSSSLLVSDQTPENLSGVHAIFGLTGAGKTTMISKLATQFVTTSHRDALTVISFADQKLGAWNQIQLICSALGIQCFRCADRQMLETIIRELPDDQCILIDTPGLHIDQTYQDIQSVVPDALMHLLVNAEISRSSCEKLLNHELGWDSVNIAEMSPQPDTWVLIDALSQQSQLHLWVKTTDGDLNQPVELIDAGRLLECAIQRLSLTDSQDLNETVEDPESGRQIGEETTTLDYLAGLRADPNDRSPKSAQNTH
jgi:flagellar biosynthesis protein FlhF